MGVSQIGRHLLFCANPRGRQVPSLVHTFQFGWKSLFGLNRKVTNLEQTPVLSCPVFESLRSKSLVWHYHNSITSDDPKVTTWVLITCYTTICIQRDRVFSRFEIFCFCLFLSSSAKFYFVFGVSTPLLTCLCPSNCSVRQLCLALISSYTLSFFVLRIPRIRLLHAIPGEA